MFYLINPAIIPKFLSLYENNILGKHPKINTIFNQMISYYLRSDETTIQYKQWWGLTKWELTIKITSQFGSSIELSESMDTELILRETDRTVLENREGRVPWEANSDIWLSYPVNSIALWSEKLVESISTTSFHVRQIGLNPSIGDEALDNTFLLSTENYSEKLVNICLVNTKLFKIFYQQ